MGWGGTRTEIRVISSYKAYGKPEILVRERARVDDGQWGTPVGNSLCAAFSCISKASYFLCRWAATSDF